MIERETVHQKVIHTKNQIHQTEHLNDEHHEATVAPPVTLDEFEKGTGAKTGASATKTVSLAEAEPVDDVNVTETSKVSKSPS